MITATLVDNSNSRTKFVFVDDSWELGERLVVNTSEISLAWLKALDKEHGLGEVYCASVVPDVEAMFREVLGERYHGLKAHTCTQISIDIEQPETLGADRIANALAVLEDPSFDYQIVVDLGTAVTFDVIAQGGRYLGGVIAPGLGAMDGYLSKKTALLPTIEFQEPSRAIGKHTKEAMNIGAVVGYRGLIREILSEIQSELRGENPNAKIKVVATGGDAALISRHLDMIDEVDPNLTMRGIQYFGQTYGMN